MDDDGLLDGIEVNGWNITLEGDSVDVTSDPTSKDTDSDGRARDKEISHSD